MNSRKIMLAATNGESVMSKAKTTTSPEEDVIEALGGFMREESVGKLYDDNDELASALNRLPEFEYPDYSWHTVESLRKEMERRIKVQARKAAEQSASIVS
jgi:hypothetical protein